MNKDKLHRLLFISVVITAGYSCTSMANSETSITNKQSKEKSKLVVADAEKTITKNPEDKATIPENDPNRFNRILQNNRIINPSVKDDGLHDPENTSLIYLQKPADAFKALPKARSGNRVDWVKAINSKKIKSQHDIYDPEVEAMIMDLNIIMQVKGSMPDVVFPHKAHTQWLDCSNCHPAIFIPQSGANKMSMAENLLGKKCGVCHGKVAFPLSSCTRCHSNKKVFVKEKK